MKLFWRTIIALTLLVATRCHSQSTEENHPSSDSEPSETAAAATEDDGQTTENPEPSSPSGEEDGQSKEPTEDESPKPDADSEVTPGKPSAGKQEQTGKGEGYLATYQEIGKILDSVDFKSVENLHLKRMLENAYQARVRNPIRDQTGQITNFSPIRGCFEKLAGGVKNLINAAKKKFKTCNTGGDNSSGCSDQQQNDFTDGLINITSTLQGCISSKRKN